VAELQGRLWEFNLVKVVIVDVTDDYRLMQPPMPSDFYPVIREIWLPRYKLATHLASVDLVSGYLYDWHERPADGQGKWYVGMVDAGLMKEPVMRPQISSAV